VIEESASIERANPAVERMRASRSGQFILAAQGRLARTAHRRRSASMR
jgi:hypothetical protein